MCVRTIIRMIMATENKIKYFGDIPGTRNILLPGDYIAEIHTGKQYLVHRDDFIEAATDLKAKTFNMSREEAREMMGKHIRVEGPIKDIEVPSIAFYRKADDDRYIGYSTHRLFLIDTTLKTVPFVYITRTFIPEHQRMHLGRLAAQLAPVIHDKATWFGFRTQSPPAVVSNMESGIFKEGQIFPWQAKYDSDPNFFAHQIMMQFWYRVHRSGAQPDIENGVSIHDHNEENRAYKPDPSHKPTMEIKKRMEKEFGMVFPRGDSVYSVGELR